MFKKHNEERALCQLLQWSPCFLSSANTLQMTRVLLLTNERTTSSKGILVSGAKKYGLATVIGEKTAGAVAGERSKKYQPGKLSAADRLWSSSLPQYCLHHNHGIVIDFIGYSSHYIFETFPWISSSYGCDLDNRKMVSALGYLTVLPNVLRKIMKICIIVLIALIVAFPEPAIAFPGDSVLKFSVSQEQPEVDGRMEKYFIDDTNGGKWMMKLSHRAFSTRAMAHQVSSRVARRLGLQVPEALICRFDEETMVQLVKMVPCEGSLKKTEMVNLSDRQREDLQSHQVVDWLLGNPDTHGGQFLFGPDGSIIAVDKDMSFKFYSSARLNIYWAYSGRSGSIYNKLYRGFRDNQYRLSFGRLFQTIDKAMSLEDTELAELVAPYFIHSFVEKGHSIEEIMSSTAIQKRISNEVNEVISRKRTLRKDFSRFIKNLSKQRGETFIAPSSDRFDDVHDSGPVQFSATWLTYTIPSLQIQDLHRISSEIKAGARKRLMRRYTLNSPPGNLLSLITVKGFELQNALSDVLFRKLHKNDSASEKFDIYSDFDVFHTTHENEENGESPALRAYTGSPSETAFMISSLLLSSRKIERDGHSLLLWNIARYVGAEKSDNELQQALDSIDPDSKPTLSVFGLHPKYEAAIIRDLKKPYTDDDVFIRLINVERKLALISENLGLENVMTYIKGDYSFRSFGCNSPFELYLTGDFPLANQRDNTTPQAIASLISEATDTEKIQPEYYVIEQNSGEFEYACSQLRRNIPEEHSGADHSASGSDDSLSPFFIRHRGTSLGSDYELLLNNSPLRGQLEPQMAPAEPNVMIRLWIR